MFVGYIYSSVVAALLSLVFVWYAGYGIVDQIRKELKKDVVKTVCLEPADKFQNIINVQDFCFAEPVTDRFEPDYFPETVIIRLKAPDIPVKKIPKSNYFLRPPPAVN